jgi:hypothetical protein
MKNKLLDILTSDQLKQELADVGSATKIAKKYGINPVTVYSAFKICDINCIVKPNRENLLSKEVLEQAYAELGSLKAVARKLGVDAGTVKRYMQQNKLEFEPQIRYDCDHEFFSYKSEEAFYIAGFIAADGCVKEKKNTSGNISYQMSIGLSIKDKDFLTKIRNTMKSNNPIFDFLIKNSKRNLKWNDTWKSELTIGSKKIFDDLAQFNIVPRKSLIYTFPKWLIEHSLCHHFVRGYNDGDGSFYIPKLQNDRIVEQIYFSMRGTPLFLETVRDILEKECELEERTKPIRISSRHGVLEYGGNGIVSKITNYLYRDATIYLPRKYEIAMKAKEFMAKSA